jgi:hypothetical protein
VYNRAARSLAFPFSFYVSPGYSSPFAPFPMYREINHFPSIDVFTFPSSRLSCYSGESRAWSLSRSGYVTWSLKLRNSHRFRAFKNGVLCRIFGNRRVVQRLFCDLRSVGQSVLVSSPHLGPMTRILITVGHLLSSRLGEPSLTRGRVCNLLVQCCHPPVQVPQKS